MAWESIWTSALSPKLTVAQQQNNATIITQYFRAQGWTDNAIASMLANMDAESNGLNPAQTQNGFPAGSASGGFGLVQWTPRTKYSDWAGADWQTNFDKQLQRIMYELNNGLQWQWRPGYTQYISFYDFTRSNDSLDYLTGAFLYYYEGPGDPAATIGYRRSRAAYWYQYITGIAPGPAGNLPIWLLFKLRWNNTKR